MLSRLLTILGTTAVFVVGFVSTASATCPTGQVSCNGQCIDLRDDEDNCGRCGNACKNAYACVQGSCSLECPSKQLACGNVCVTPASNPSHCGGCGKACANGEYCSGGQCLKVCVEPLKTGSNTDATKTRK